MLLPSKDPAFLFRHFSPFGKLLCLDRSRAIDKLHGIYSVFVL
jgi:hypothetical protein